MNNMVFRMALIGIGGPSAFSKASENPFFLFLMALLLLFAFFVFFTMEWYSLELSSFLMESFHNLPGAMPSSSSIFAIAGDPSLK